MYLLLIKPKETMNIAEIERQQLLNEIKEQFVTFEYTFHLQIATIFWLVMEKDQPYMVALGTLVAVMRN
jgi:hypothetical protein